MGGRHFQPMSPPISLGPPESGDGVKATIDQN
jgi:hypothetical protein